MIIRNASPEEMSGTSFALWSEDNEGSTITVIEHEGEIVAFAQHDGSYIYFIESAITGAGYARALVEYILDGADYAEAINVDCACEAFWSRMGFQPTEEKGVWAWYPDED